MINILTKEQQDLVEKNHNLIYGYASKNKLSLDDYYDILAIGLCKAALNFNENKGAFSTIAYYCMKNEVGIYLRSLQKTTAIPKDKILSYDSYIDNEKSNDSFLNFGSCSVNDNVLDEITLKMFIASLSEKEQIVVKMLLKNIGKVEIANKMNCTRMNVYLIIKKIKEKYCLYFQIPKNQVS